MHEIPDITLQEPWHGVERPNLPPWPIPWLVGRCEWFARCENTATGTVAHPILSDVPTCQHCADSLDLTVVPYPFQKKAANLMRQPININVPADQWEPNGEDDPLAVLTGPTLVINGLSMHLEAWQVTLNEPDGTQDPTTEVEIEFDQLHIAVHADGHFQTLRIGDRDYVILASPHC